MTPKTGDKVLVQIPGRTDLSEVVVAKVTWDDMWFTDTNLIVYRVADALPVSPASGTEAA